MTNVTLTCCNVFHHVLEVRGYDSYCKYGCNGACLDFPLTNYLFAGHVTATSQWQTWIFF